MMFLVVGLFLMFLFLQACEGRALAVGKR